TAKSPARWLDVDRIGECPATSAHQHHGHEHHASAKNQRCKQFLHSDLLSQCGSVTSDDRRLECLVVGLVHSLPAIIEERDSRTDPLVLGSAWTPRLPLPQLCILAARSGRFPLGTPPLFHKSDRTPGRESGRNRHRTCPRW